MSNNKKRVDNLYLGNDKSVSNDSDKIGYPTVRIGEKLEPNVASYLIAEIFPISDTLGDYSFTISGSVIENDDIYYWINQSFYVTSSITQQSIINIENPHIIIIRTGNKIGIHLMAHTNNIRYGIEIKVNCITLKLSSLLLKVAVKNGKNIYYY